MATLLSSGPRHLFLRLQIHLISYVVCASREDLNEIVKIHRLSICHSRNATIAKTIQVGSNCGIKSNMTVYCFFYLISTMSIQLFQYYIPFFVNSVDPDQLALVEAS